MIPSSWKCWNLYQYLISRQHIRSTISGLVTKVLSIPSMFLIRTFLAIKKALGHCAGQESYSVVKCWSCTQIIRPPTLKQQLREERICRIHMLNAKVVQQMVLSPFLGFVNSILFFFLPLISQISIQLALDIFLCGEQMTSLYIVLFPM